MRFSPEPAKLAELLRRVALRVDADGPSALRIAKDWQIPLASSSGPGPKNEVSDTVGNTASRRADADSRRGKVNEADSIAKLYGRAVHHMDRLEHHAAIVEAILELVMRDIPDEQREAMQRNASTGYCECCGRWVPGTSIDRLRAGFCDACRKAYAKAGKPDKATFIRKRRANLERKEARQ